MTPTADIISDELPPLIEQLRTALASASVLTDQISAIVAGGQTESGAADLTAADIGRINKLGRVAHLHLCVIEENGQISLGESLQIRRQLYGSKVGATANLFGTRGSGALFFRTVDFGEPRDDEQEVRMTEEGKRIALRWRELNPDHLDDASKLEINEWEQYADRYGSRPGTYKAYIDVWTTVPEAQEEFSSWAAFSQCANAEPKRREVNPDLVATAERLMEEGGYQIGTATSRGARQWE